MLSNSVCKYLSATCYWLFPLPKCHELMGKHTHTHIQNFFPSDGITFVVVWTINNCEDPGIDITSKSILRKSNDKNEKHLIPGINTTHFCESPIEVNSYSWCSAVMSVSYEWIKMRLLWALLLESLLASGLLWLNNVATHRKSEKRSEKDQAGIDTSAECSVQHVSTSISLSWFGIRNCCNGEIVIFFFFPSFTGRGEWTNRRGAAEMSKDLNDALKCL